MSTPHLGTVRDRDWHGAVRRHATQVLLITTVGVLLSALNSSTVLIALPEIFRGLGLQPLEPGNIGYLLWMLMGYLLVTSVTVVLSGRLGDLYGRARMFTLGSLVFTVAGLAAGLVPMGGGNGATAIIVLRCVQGVGGALMMANSTALIIDAFPPTRRGTAVGINQVVIVAGSFLGLILGGLMAVINWRWVFLVVVPFGLVATVWAWLVLKDGPRDPDAPKRGLDIPGNITLAVGLTGILLAMTYGLQPYGGHVTGWTSPFVMICAIGGVLVLGLFVVVESRVQDPLFDLSLFKIRAFTAGNLANLFMAIARGGMQFMLILWLQGIWLPLHGYSFESTPLWAGIFMVPFTVGFLLAGPVSGALSDRYGAKLFVTGGAILTAFTFFGLMLLPTNFNFAEFAVILLLMGVGMGLFATPNTTAIMNSVPAAARGAASGMRFTFQNAGSVVSMGLFFTLLVLGLSSSLPDAMSSGLIAQGVPQAAADAAAQTPAVASLFAAFLGYNPMATLLDPSVLAALPQSTADLVTGHEFFPELMSDPFRSGLAVVFTVSILLAIGAAIASLFRGGRFVHDEEIEADAEVVHELVATPVPQPEGQA